MYYLFLEMKKMKKKSRIVEKKLEEDLRIAEIEDITEISYMA